MTSFTVAALAVIWAGPHRASLQYALTPGYLLTRHGLWRNRIEIVPRAKVQDVRVVEHSIARLRGQATVVVRTAAGSAKVVAIPRSEALELATSASGSGARAGEHEAV